ncbi:MAG: alpha/beta hydrolase, partial [Acidobacteria bacterium]|nr:alpha/beta hydrolase [Acidobacteriota bacterium]
MIRIVWVSAGLLLMAYLPLSYSARGVDESVMRPGDGIEVVEGTRSIAFTPLAGAESNPGLLFIPGGMVDPRAYAPLLRSVARAGHPALLVKLPSLGGRHAMGEQGREEAVGRALAALDRAPGDRTWIVAGHSLGGALAARVGRHNPPRMRGLALIGTTHPRDFSLAAYPHPVVKIYATRDRIAPLGRMKANAANLPPSTRWIAIEGGNHSQFGWYGFQLLDGRAGISREAQQEQLLRALLDMLRAADARAGVVRASRRAASRPGPAALNSTRAAPLL